ncbi:MAG: PEP-CTERM sorting domain-containing protein [Fimbriimonadaceae bacterium]|jgi:hypothetical protein|nr:PEP-CTERM sorting domain-containing protein [Fimbriimonadaceae bacterium]
MKKLLVLAAAVVTVGAANAQIITQWNFNGTSATTVPGGATSPTAHIGTGTAALLGGVTASFSSGTANGGSSDPVTTSPANYGWQTTTYAAQGTGSGTRGVEFRVSTAGQQGIIVDFDVRHSNTSSRWLQFQYTTDGTSFIDSLKFENSAGDTWFNNLTVDLSGVSAVNDNANFGFRIVTIFDPNGSGYVAASSAGGYAGTGTLRWDMVTVTGQPVPEPATMTILGLGLAAAALRRRKK